MDKTRTRVIDSRTLPHCWQEKKALRVIDEYFKVNSNTKPTKPYVMAAYMALTWVASDKQQEHFQITVEKIAERVGCGKRIITDILKLLEKLNLLRIHYQFNEAANQHFASEYELLNASDTLKDNPGVLQTPLHPALKVPPPAYNAVPSPALKTAPTAPDADNKKESLYKKNYKNRTFPSPLPSSHKSQSDVTVNGSRKGKKEKREKGKIDRNLFEQLRSGIYRNDLFTMYDNLLRIRSIEELAGDAAYKAIKFVLVNNEEFLRQEYSTNYSKFPKDEMSEVVAKRFPYDKLPDSSDEDARRNFFVSAVCNTVAEAMIERLEADRGKMKR